MLFEDWFPIAKAMPWSNKEQITNIKEDFWKKSWCPGKKLLYFHPHGVHNAHARLCDVGSGAITGPLIVLWKIARCPLYVLFPKRGNEEALQSNTLTQPVRHIDCNINPARHTDGYARSTTKVPRQIHRNRPGQRSRCCSTEATIHFQSDPLPAAGWKEPNKVPHWIKRAATMMMTKLFVMLSLMLKYNKADWVLTNQKNDRVFIHSEDKVNYTPGSHSDLCYFI